MKLFHKLLPLLGAILVAGALVACGGGSDENPPTEKTIVMIGDSITDSDVGWLSDLSKGWVNIANMKLRDRGVTLINLAKSGETTNSGLDKLDDYLATNADAAYIFLGGNDIFHNTTFDGTEQRLRAIIDALLEQKPRQILMVGLVYPDGLLNDPNWLQDQSLRVDIAQVVPRIVADYPDYITYMPDFFEGIPPEGLQPEGIHVAESHHEFVADRMIPKLLALLE